MPQFLLLSFVTNLNLLNVFSPLNLLDHIENYITFYFTIYSHTYIQK